MDMPNKKPGGPKGPKKPTPPKSITGKLLTQKLNELALDIVDSQLIDGETKLLTRTELLAAEIWDAACGIQRNEDGTTTFTHRPTPWAVGVIYERLEGKVVPRAKDSSNRPSLKQKISEQNKLKANGISKDVS